MFSDRGRNFTPLVRSKALLWKCIQCKTSSKSIQSRQAYCRALTGTRQGNCTSPTSLQINYRYNIIGDELLLNFGMKFQHLLPWQPLRTSQCQDGDEVLKCVNEDVRAQKDALENLNTQENVKKDSNRYFAEKV